MKKNRNIPFGYCIVNGEYALNAAEAEAVKQIFEQYIGGKSLNNIAAEMTVPYNQSKPIWNKNMVKRVLENRRYIGENGFIQIISCDDFYTAEKIKAEKCTIKQPKPTARLEEPDTELEIIYEPSDTVARLTKEIYRLLDSDNPDKDTLKILIMKCAAEKYNCCKYAERSVENANSNN